MSDHIIIKGARTHNLKNINLELPRNKMIVFTGISGSGKSSLAFDTIFAEGQRRYVESLSAYARQFLHKLQKPDVDEIQGLSPAISIDQGARSANPRSTVATMTEIYDYVRVLFARVGKAHCVTCGKHIEKLSTDEIVNLAMKKYPWPIKVSAPVVRGRKGEYYQLLYDLLGKGYREVEINGKKHSLRERINLDRYKTHSINVLIDEVRTKEELHEAIERALGEADGMVKINDDILSNRFVCTNDGFSFAEIEPRLFSFNSPYGACEECHGLGLRDFFSDDICHVCDGARLRKEALHVFVEKKSIIQVCALTIEEAHVFFKELSLSSRDMEIASQVIREIKYRLEFLVNVGLTYITLDRRAGTLSGGESQRIRLASQLGSALVGALYVLDEPTIGLHPSDTARLLKTLKVLKDLGNTIIVVEHDEDTIFSSDHLVDIGPGAGIHGGNIVVEGPTEELITNKKMKSCTLSYLRGDTSIPIPEKRRSKERGALKIRGGKLFNVKGLNLDIPLGRLVVISGVSGSGKSTVLYEMLHRNFDSRAPVHCSHFLGKEYVSRSVLVNQSSIGRTPRSNPATYTGAFTFIRELFAATEEARFKGWKPRRFSFNVPGGRCEACEGNGVIAVEMHFLPTIYVTCDVCRGSRFDKETLKVKYNNKSISDLLHLTVEEAHDFFQDIPAIADRLKTLNDVGLGYLALGQPAPTLSGGESQRLKIASELYRPFEERTLYLLDEPTVGLHYDDVKKLLGVLNLLVNRGNTVVVIEHNLDVIKSADWVIDMGPGGGDAGGKVIAQGTPEEVAEDESSRTGMYLKRVLNKVKSP